ncbi:MAG: hypothetical protein OXH57_07150 [Ekhidna sp.]|nr:hypothetical protein [Ekhidna sp.]
MQVNETVKILKDKLPRGSFKLIAAKAGVHHVSVTKFFRGQVNNVDLYKKILNATVSYVDEYTLENFKKVNQMIIKLMTYTITYDDLLTRGIPKEVIDEGMARFNNYRYGEPAL